MQSLQIMRVSRNGNTVKSGRETGTPVRSVALLRVFSRFSNQRKSASCHNASAWIAVVFPELFGPAKTR